MLSILQAGALTIVFAAATLGLGSAIGPRTISEALPRMAAGVSLALAFWFGGGWIGYVIGLSNAATAGLLATAAALVVGVRRDALTTAWRAAEVRSFAGLWLLFVVWSLALLALVVTYSGGGWAADWVEHWHRTVFFLDRQPLGATFDDSLLRARPPLANLVIALALPVAGRSFAMYQVTVTLFGTLILLPTLIVARRWHDRPATAWWVLMVLMVSPVVAQNLTFAWTKLPAAVFALLGIALVWPDSTSNRAARTCGALALGAGVVTHYSVIPWVGAVAVAWLLAWRVSGRPGMRWREAAMLAAAFAALPAVWFGWTAIKFGGSGTLAATTTAAAWREHRGMEQLVVFMRNLYDTVVPFLLRGEPPGGLILQTSQLGRLRDIAFNTYQINLPLAFGIGGFVVLALRVLRPVRRSPDAEMATTSLFCAVVTAVAIVAGIAVATMRDKWGLAHICLQPLVIVGLARIAAELARGGALVATWAALTVIDFTFGIALHFGLESWALAPVVAPGGDGTAFVRQLSGCAELNAAAKNLFQLRFFADTVAISPIGVGLLLVGLLATVVLRLRHSATLA